MEKYNIPEGMPPKLGHILGLIHHSIHDGKFGVAKVLHKQSGVTLWCLCAIRETETTYESLPVAVLSPLDSDEMDAQETFLCHVQDMTGSKVAVILELIGPTPEHEGEPGEDPQSFGA